MSDQPPSDQGVPWRVVRGSGFVVDDPLGGVGLVQIDTKNFLVLQKFRYTDAGVRADLRRSLSSQRDKPDDIERAIEDACTFTPTTENPTDLASIPWFMRWFVNTYGDHTLAAILHDQQIGTPANSGNLKSDTLSDRFFREMMRTCGVPWLQRWIMWSGVALRSRWSAGGIRRLSVALWIVTAFVGYGSLILAVGASAFDWSHPLPVSALWAIAVVLPFVAALLWGRQAGGSLIAAIAVPWILPAAVLGLAGVAVYKVLEAIFGRLGLS